MKALAARRAAPAKAAPKGAPIKNATIKDVAREADVSVASASRALNGFANVTEATRARVLDAAKRLRYVPHVGARSLITQRTGMIGVLLPDMYGEFFSELIRGVDAAARERGLHLFVSSAHGDAAEAGDVIRAMRGRVDGMIVMSPHVDKRFAEDHLTGEMPLVLMNARAGAGVEAINIDNCGGARALTQHLIGTGRRRIALISGPKGNFDAEERLRGYRLAMRAAGLPIGPVLDGDFTEAAGALAARRLMAEGALPDGVFALNDMMAIGCLGAFAQAGVDVPGAVAVAGFDDVPIAAYVRPGLTTMRVDIARLGRLGFEQLIAGVEGRRAEPIAAIAPELIVRASTAR